MSTQPTCLLLPFEMWLHILEDVVTSQWRADVFFPPLDDYASLSGFKAACKAFHTLFLGLHEILRDRNVSVSDAGKLLRKKNVQSEGVRHLTIEHNTTLADLQLFIPRFEKLISLSITCADRSFGLLGPQTFLASEKLLRLDFTYQSIWWHAPTLDFPNLRELRLSSKKPLERRTEPVYVHAMYISAERFAAELINTVRKLRHLKYLSAHVALDDQGTIPAIRRAHERDHYSCTTEAPPPSFTQCDMCLRNYSTAEIDRVREAKLSLMLAQKLPELERVMWMNAWNDSFYDEEGMRESRICRKANGKITVTVDEQ